MGTLWDETVERDAEMRLRAMTKYRPIGNAAYAWVIDGSDRWFHRSHGVWREIEQPWFARFGVELRLRIHGGLIVGGPSLPPPVAS